MSAIETIAGVLDREQRIALDGFWGDIRYEYDGSGNVIYKGATIFHKAATDTEVWVVWKYTYDVSDNVTRIEGPLAGTWDGRASLEWSA